MKKTALTLVAMLAVALMMVLSSTVALAGWDYSDCPPAAAKANPSATALVIWHGMEDPPAATQAWAATNPGNKLGTK